MRKGARLQLILVEWKILYHHWLLTDAGELDIGMGSSCRQLGTVHIRPEVLGNGPEADSKALLCRARHIDEPPTRVPWIVVAARKGQLAVLEATLAALTVLLVLLAVPLTQQSQTIPVFAIKLAVNVGFRPT